MPYGRKSKLSNVVCGQFKAPGQKNLVTFLRHLFVAFAEFPGALFVHTDWNNPCEESCNFDEMILLDSLRRIHKENRNLIEAPGHLLDATEIGVAISICLLMQTYDWSGYLYLASGKATFLFWEGELIDYWLSDRTLSSNVMEVFHRFCQPSSSSKESFVALGGKYTLPDETTDIATTHNDI